MLKLDSVRLCAFLLNKNINISSNLEKGQGPVRCPPPLSDTSLTTIIVAKLTEFLFRSKNKSKALTYNRLKLLNCLLI